jgi:hypothetical protein
MARFVDARLTVIVLMNLDDVDLDSIVNGVAALYLPQTRAAGGPTIRAFCPRWAKLFQTLEVA